MSVEFVPKGIYKVFFYEHETTNLRIARGRVVNYDSGNVVLEDTQTGELTILKYRYIQQLFRVQKEDTKDEKV